MLFGVCVYASLFFWCCCEMGASNWFGRSSEAKLRETPAATAFWIKFTQIHIYRIFICFFLSVLSMPFLRACRLIYDPRISFSLLITCCGAPGRVKSLFFATHSMHDFHQTSLCEFFAWELDKNTPARFISLVCSRSSRTREIVSI